MCTFLFPYFLCNVLKKHNKQAIIAVVVRFLVFCLYLRILL